VPYGLDRLAEAEPDEPVLLVEGESDALTCWHHDILALGIPGADCWRSDWASLLDGRPILVWREPDQGGKTFVRRLAPHLPDLRVIRSPDGIKDLSDLHLAHADAFTDRLESLMEGAAPTDSGPSEENAKDEEGDAELPQKTILLNLTSGHYLFSDDRDRPYVWLEVEDHREVWPLDGRRFKSWMALRFYEETGSAPSASVLSDALAVLIGQALFKSTRHELANRLSRGPEGELWYDLADAAWQAIRVDVEGWEVVPDPPLQFRRFSHQLPQVEPEPGGSLTEVLPFLNLASPDDEILVPVWLVAALIPDIPRAVLVPWGTQGSAKSTLTRMLRAIIDPSSVPMPRFPRGDGEMAQALDHNAVLCFDNLSSLKPRTSDTLCRAVTGDGFSKRKLYSDDDDILYRFRRVLVLNGINIPAQRPDLLDRCLLIRLEKISEETRREEREVWSQFEAALPRIFGAVLTTLADAMVLEPTVRLDYLPRMADWARWGFAIAEAAGLGGERFLDAYRANRAVQNEEALTSHPVGAAVMAFMADRDEWTGEPSELLRKLEKVADREKIDRQQRLWPKASNWLRRRLNEVEPNLAEADIQYESGWGDGRLLRLWKDSAPSKEGAVDTVDAVDAVERHATTDDPSPWHAHGTHGVDTDIVGVPRDRKATPDKASHGNHGTHSIPRGNSARPDPDEDPDAFERWAIQEEAYDATHVSWEQS
jgi:hypothetical protein